ncbi:Transposase [Cordylochernes scorpioides]|uniref:Transposase n=1 Tax=Cordylochernes scorpioides TaxID=51811 RepID=A0ABY6JZH6_9ARAC|nr:Transposase [Cordylochernes scorpioides]
MKLTSVVKATIYKYHLGLEGSLQILLDFKVDDQLYSDHHPLVLTIKGQNFNEKKTKREDYNITRYRWSADGLATFKMKLEELREKNIPASDDLVYTFNQRILEAMSSAKITYSIKGGPRKSKPWFDKDCYDMKKLAKESLKKYRKTNRLEDRECYASSRKKYLALLDLKRKGFDNEKQEILRNAKDSKTFWKTIALYKSTSIIQGEISIQDWLNFYRELMTTEKNLRICNLHNVISQNDPILDSEITNADIYKEIAGLRSNKACGPDGIPNEVLKTLPDSYILLLKQLYNSVMTTGKYPAIWTNSTIHPIFKNGYKNSPSNYRDLPSVNLPEFGDIHLLLYADDIAIIGESRINLQKKIKILKEYLDENLMTLNESKSKIMVFRNGVRAVLMYAAPLWATEHKDLLDNIQDIFIRRFLNLPRYTPGYLIRLETGRISLSVTALKLTLKYWLRGHDPNLIRIPVIPSIQNIPLFINKRQFAEGNVSFIYNGNTSFRAQQPFDRTISRRLVANGLHSCRPLRRLPLTPPNRRQRLEWCRARSTWMTEWHRVVFSDESRFCLSSDSRRVRVWRRRGERSNPAAIVERPTVRQRGIMVWGAIAYDSRSPLLRIQGTMTAQRYVDDVLRPVTLPYLQGVPNALYQQYNARPHTARISQQALQDVQMLPWPPYSPDLSPIEHVWDIIGRRLHALPQPRSEDELWQMVEREWRAIPQDAIRTLIDSLPRRVAACIAVRGGPTCY